MQMYWILPLTLDLTPHIELFLLWFLPCLTMTWEVAWLGRVGNEKDCFEHHLSAFIRLLIMRHPSFYIQTKSTVFLCIYGKSLRDFQILLGFLFTSFSHPIIGDLKESTSIFYATGQMPFYYQKKISQWSLFNLSADFQSGKCLVHF